MKWPQLLWPQLFPLKMNRLTVNNLKTKLDCQSSRCGHSNRTVPSETALATYRHFREAEGTIAPDHTAWLSTFPHSVCAFVSCIMPGSHPETHNGPCDLVQATRTSASAGPTHASLPHCGVSITPTTTNAPDRYSGCRSASLVSLKLRSIRCIHWQLGGVR